MPQVKLRILKAKRSTTRPIADGPFEWSVLTRWPSGGLLIPKPWWWKARESGPPKMTLYKSGLGFYYNLPRNTWILWEYLTHPFTSQEKDESQYLPRKCNEVIKMLEEIGTPENVPTFVADVKAKKACQIGIWVGRHFPRSCVCLTLRIQTPPENRRIVGLIRDS